MYIADYSRFGLWLVSGLLLSGCAAVVPHTLHTPLLTQRGQAEVVAATGLHGTGLQAAYAATDHVALTASGQQHIPRGSDNWSYAGEVGVGHLWHQSTKHHWAMYGGLGYGAGYAKPTGWGDDYGGTITRDRVRYGYLYVQPTYALWDGEYGLSVAVKVSRYHFLRWTRYDDYPTFDQNTNEYTRVLTVYNRKGYAMTAVQPGLNFYAAVGRRFRFLTTGSLVVPLTLSSAPQMTHVAVGVGLQWRLGPLPE